MSEVVIPLDKHDAANQIQRIARGRQGRQGQILLKKKKAAQKRAEANTEVTYYGVSRGRKGRNNVSKSRAQELALLRNQSNQNQVHRPKRDTSLTDGVGLDFSIIRKGLSIYGEHPLLLNHVFLQLEIESKKLNNLDVLKDYPHLMYLNISDNNISDLSVLSKLPTLIQLRAKKNNLSKCLDFCPPKSTKGNAWSTGHTAMGSMIVLADMSDNAISYIDDLSEHCNLECLILANNSILAITGLNHLNFLQVLDLSDNYIRVIEGLHALPVLVELNLSRNQIETLHGIEHCKSLQSLNISYNQISCLYKLQYNSNLSYLDATYNAIAFIRNVEYLKSLPFLRVLMLFGNDCSVKPYYRKRVCYLLPKLPFLDQSPLAAEELVLAYNLYEDPKGDIEARKQAFLSYFPDEDFVNHSPLFIDDEADEFPRDLLVDMRDADDERFESVCRKIINEMAEDTTISAIEHAALNVVVRSASTNPHDDNLLVN